MFEKAARMKLRFNTAKGLLAVEDLWDLPLTSSPNKVSLDSIACSLHKELKNNDTVSFVNKDTKPDEIKQLSFDIVKHIIKVRLAENEETNIARKRAEQKQHILSLIAEKEGDTLKGMSLEELYKKVEELN